MEQRIEVQSGTGTRVVEELAGAGSRSYAFIVDWHIRIVLVLGWYLGCMAFLRTADLFGFWRDAQFSELAWMSIPPLAIYLLYHPVLEVAMAGNSPGKRYAGVAVVDEVGAPPTVGAILIRNVFRLIDSLPMAYTVGLVTVMLSKQHVRFGDMVAGTVMVRTRDTLTHRLDVLERVRAAPVDPTTAEFVIELLDRWSTLENAQRVRLGSALLEREGVTPADDKPRTIRNALEKLLTPA